jgi:hypothetical protein
MWFGVAKSTDFGRTWALVWKESDKAGSNIRDAWLTPTFGPGWSGRPLYLGVAPGDPDVCSATDMGRTIRTVDGGKTWDAVYSRRANGGWASTGLDVTTSYGVHFEPFRSAPHVHQLHRYRSFSQRGWRQKLRHCNRRCSQRMEEHYLLDGIRSRGAWQSVGRGKLDSRLAPTQNVERDGGFNVPRRGDA